MLKILLNIYYSINFIIRYLFSNSVDEKSILKKFLNEENLIFFDIGSNQGNNLSIVKKYFSNRNLEIHSFEPNRNSYQVLKKKFPDLKVNNVAVSDYSGTSTFYEMHLSTQSSLYERKQYPLAKVKSQYEATVIKLDDYITSNKIPKIDFIKIDTEGNDYKVLYGLKNSLKNLKINLIKVECIFENGDNSNFEKIYIFLNSYGYKIYAIPVLKHVGNKIFLMDIYFAK